MELKVKLTDGAPLPMHAKKGDAGLDLTSRQEIDVLPHSTMLVGTGVSVEIPEGYVGLQFPRSGIASKRDLNLANCVGVIDSGYRGEILAPVHNCGKIARHVDKGERICQLVIVPYVTCECVEVNKLSETERGSNGYGSTGTGELSGQMTVDDCLEDVEDPYIEFID